MGRFLWIPAGKQIHFIKRFSSLYWEIKEMIEFIIPLNKQFHLFLVNCTKCGLITVSRIAFHICGPKSCYCWGLRDKEIEPSCGQSKYYNPLRFNVDSINILIFCINISDLWTEKYHTNPALHFQETEEKPTIHRNNACASWHYTNIKHKLCSQGHIKCPVFKGIRRGSENRSGNKRVT